MDLRLLGPVEAHVHGRRVPLGPPRQRFVLAVLALEANRAVAVERLVELSWPEAPPRTATQAVQVCVSRLRRALADEPGVELVRQGSGYALRTDRSAIDVHRFRALSTRPGTRPATRRGSNCCPPPWPSGAERHSTWSAWRRWRTGPRPR